MNVSPEILANKYIVIEDEKELFAVLDWIDDVLKVHHGRSLCVALNIDRRLNPDKKCYILFNHDGSGVENVPYERFRVYDISEKCLELKVEFTAKLVVSNVTLAAPTVTIDGKKYLLDDVVALLNNAGTLPVSC